MEIFGKRPWIQAAIDKFTLEEAIPCAQMAVDCGVDWVEVGTPLIYGEGLGIRELKKIAGDKASIMVDFKIRTNVYDIFLKAKDFVGFIVAEAPGFFNPGVSLFYKARCFSLSLVITSAIA